MSKVSAKEQKIHKVIKRIRDSFHESSATYTQGRCYQFACILREIFGGDLHFTKNKGHVVTKISGKFYDIQGDVEYHYGDESTADWVELTEQGEWNWDSNYHSGSISEYMNKYTE